MHFKAVSDDNRKLNLNWDRVNLYVSRYKPSTPFDVEIVRRVSRRSDAMRGYFFAEVLPKLSRELGYEPHEDLLVHEQLKIRYFKITPDKRGIYRNVPSVFSNKSKLGVPQKKEYVDYVVRQAAHAGVYCNDPN